jgi:hypothetical protein
MPYARFSGNVAIGTVDVVAILGPLTAHVIEHFRPVIERTLYQVKKSDTDWLDYTSFLVLAAESRPSDRPLFDNLKRLRETLAFLGSSGPVDYHLYLQGPDALYTDLEVLQSSCSLPDVQFHFHVTLSQPRTRCVVPRERKSYLIATGPYIVAMLSSRRPSSRIRAQYASDKRIQNCHAES